MKIGDLVRLRLELNGGKGYYIKKDEVGIVVKIAEPTPDCAMGTAYVKFPGSMYITCRWQELEVISESR